MSCASLSYGSLQRELNRQAFGSMIMDGPGGSLIFAWAIGVATFIVLLGMPLLIVPLTGAAAVISVRTFRAYMQDPVVMARILPGVVRELCSAPGVSDRTIEAVLEHGHRLFAEIVVKVIWTTRGESNPSRALLVGQALEMVLLQRDLASQAAELARVLQFVGQTGAGPASLIVTNTVAMRRQADQAAAVMDEIIEQLEILLLQITQLGVGKLDLVQAGEFARQARESLEQMQVEVSTRQAVADRLFADLATPAPNTRISADPIEKGH
jgi:hypothetical protein